MQDYEVKIWRYPCARIFFSHGSHEFPCKSLPQNRVPPLPARSFEKILYRGFLVTGFSQVTIR